MGIPIFLDFEEDSAPTLFSADHHSGTQSNTPTVVPPTLPPRHPHRRLTQHYQTLRQQHLEPQPLHRHQLQREPQQQGLIHGRHEHRADLPVDQDRHSLSSIEPPRSSVLFRQHRQQQGDTRGTMLQEAQQVTIAMVVSENPRSAVNSQASRDNIRSSYNDDDDQDSRYDLRHQRGLEFDRQMAIYERLQQQRQEHHVQYQAQLVAAGYNPGVPELQTAVPDIPDTPGTILDTALQTDQQLVNPEATNSGRHHHRSFYAHRQHGRQGQHRIPRSRPRLSTLLWPSSLSSTPDLPSLPTLPSSNSTSTFDSWDRNSHGHSSRTSVVDFRPVPPTIFVQFVEPCTNHGGAVRNHESFREAARQLAIPLREICSLMPVLNAMCCIAVDPAELWKLAQIPVVRHLWRGMSLSTTDNIRHWNEPVFTPSPPPPLIPRHPDIASVQENTRRSHIPEISAAERHHGFMPTPSSSPPFNPSSLLRADALTNTHFRADVSLSAGAQWSQVQRENILIHSGDMGTLFSPPLNSPRPLFPSPSSLSWSNSVHTVLQLPDRPINSALTLPRTDGHVLGQSFLQPIPAQPRQSRIVSDVAVRISTRDETAQLTSGSRSRGSAASSSRTRPSSDTTRTLTESREISIPSPSSAFRGARDRYSSSSWSEIPAFGEESTRPSAALSDGEEDVLQFAYRATSMPAMLSRPLRQAALTDIMMQTSIEGPDHISSEAEGEEGTVLVESDNETQGSMESIRSGGVHYLDGTNEIGVDEDKSEGETTDNRRTDVIDNIPSLHCNNKNNDNVVDALMENCGTRSDINNSHQTHRDGSESGVRQLPQIQQKERCMDATEIAGGSRKSDREGEGILYCHPREMDTDGDCNRPRNHNPKVDGNAGSNMKNTSIINSNMNENNNSNDISSIATIEECSANVTPCNHACPREQRHKESKECIKEADGGTYDNYESEINTPSAQSCVGSADMAFSYTPAFSALVIRSRIIPTPQQWRQQHCRP